MTAIPTKWISFMCAVDGYNSPTMQLTKEITTLSWGKKNEKLGKTIK